MILTGNILLKLEEKATTKSGLILPRSMTTEENIGIVKMTGKAKKDMPQEVVPGDRVVFNHKTHRKRSFELDGEDVVLIAQEDIYLIQKKK